MSGRRCDLDRVQQFSLQDLEPRDRAAPRRQELLNERGGIDSEIDGPSRRRLVQGSGGIEALNAGPLPPMFGFTTIGNRRSRAAAGASLTLLMTRARGYRTPSRRRRSSCADFESSSR
jgi:hypothetical protein